jgi:lysophospholipase L1-like esterase
VRWLAASLLLIASMARADQGAQGQPKVIQFWGDSITQGLDYLQTGSYPSSWTVVDRGRAGETYSSTSTAGALDRFTDSTQWDGGGTPGTCDDLASSDCGFDKTNTYFPATDVVVIMWGTNDIKAYAGTGASPIDQWDDDHCAGCVSPTGFERVVTAADGILDAIQAAGKACVVGIPPPIYGTIKDINYTTMVQRGKVLRDQLVAQAFEHECAVADFYQLWLNQPQPWALYNLCPLINSPGEGLGDCVQFDTQLDTRRKASVVMAGAIMDAWRIHTLPFVRVNALTDAGIEDAMSRADARKGARVVFPAGTYPTIQFDQTKLTSTLLRGGLILEGAGIDSTILQYPTDQSETGALLRLDNINNVFIHGFTFDGLALTARLDAVGCAGGSPPDLCPDRNYHTAISMNSPGQMIKSNIGISGNKFVNWPAHAIWVENARTVGIIGNTVSDIGCDFTVGPGAVSAFIPCHADWNVTTGTQQVGNGINVTRESRRIAIVSNTVTFAAKYCVGFGVSSGDITQIEAVDGLISQNTLSNCGGENSIHSAVNTTWQFNTVSWPQTARRYNATGINGSCGLMVGDKAYGNRVLSSTIASLGPGLCIWNDDGHDNLFRNLVFVNDCLQDVASSGIVQIDPAGAATMGSVILDDIRITDDASNFCDRAFDAQGVTQGSTGIVATGFTADGEIRFQSSTFGSLVGCTLTEGAAVVNNSTGGAVAVTGCP